jgi:hypothetical protein
VRLTAPKGARSYLKPLDFIGRAWQAAPHEAIWHGAYSLARSGG